MHPLGVVTDESICSGSYYGAAFSASRLSGEPRTMGSAEIEKTGIYILKITGYPGEFFLQTLPWWISLKRSAQTADRRLPPAHCVTVLIPPWILFPNIHSACTVYVKNDFRPCQAYRKVGFPPALCCTFFTIAHPAAGLVDAVQWRLDYCLI